MATFTMINSQLCRDNQVYVQLKPTPLALSKRIVAMHHTALTAQPLLTSTTSYDANDQPIATLRNKTLHSELIIHATADVCIVHNTTVPLMEAARTFQLHNETYQATLNLAHTVTFTKGDVIISTMTTFSSNWDKQADTYTTEADDFHLHLAALITTTFNR